jgi:SHS2 domain-containing protein
MPYKYHEEIAWADIAFEASGRSLPELFESCGLAVTNTMTQDLRKIKLKQKIEFGVEEKNVEQALHKFMQEIVFYKDARGLLLSKFKISVEESKSEVKVHCIAHGDKIDPKKHKMVVDVKAVTWHQYKVEKTQKGWKAFVILDV